MSETKSVQQQVFDVCDVLYNLDEKISVRIILERLENVSSTSTVHRYYKEWRDDRDAKQKSLVDRLGFSAEFSRAFGNEIQRFINDSQTTHDRISAEATAQTEEVIAELARSEKVLAERTLELEQLKISSSSRIASFESEVAHLNSKLIEKVKVESDIQQQYNASVEKIRELEQLLAETKHGAATQISELKQSLAVAAVYKDQAQTLGTKLSAIEKDHAVAVNNIEKMTSERKTLNEQLSASQREEDNLKKRLIASHSKNKTLQELSVRTEKQIIEQSVQLERLTEDLRLSTETIDTLSQQLNDQAVGSDDSKR